MPKPYYLIVTAVAYSMMQSAAMAQTAAPSSSVRDCDGCPEMVSVAGGTFTMGSPETEECRDDDEGPQHDVTVRPFAVSKHEITWNEWEACVAGGGCDGSGPESVGGDAGWGKGDRPVINVSWDDAKAYAAWLSQKTGKSYRLLSEAEWEYAARAGTTTRFSWGEQDPVCDESALNGANFRACADDRTRPVGSFKPNAFGLFDMHGNVWEWVEDCWHGGYKGAPADGSAWTQDGRCRYRVFRGGSWGDRARCPRSANRARNTPDFRVNHLGFRIARTVGASD